MSSSFRYGGVALAVLVLVLSALCRCVIVSADDTVHVSILNRLGEGRSINLHCQSKDNDLGPQTVADGADYGWEFSINFSGTTLFYCDMGWSSVGEFHFDSYAYQRDRSRCDSECKWLISEEGVYGFNGGTGFWEFMYHWPNN